MMEDTFDIDLVIPYSDDDDNGKASVWEQC